MEISGAVVSPRTLFKPEVESYFRESLQKLFLHSVDQSWTGKLYREFLVSDCVFSQRVLQGYQYGYDLFDFLSWALG